MLKIAHIAARPILDSRDEWTIEAEVALSDGSVGVASVPAGKSRGRREAAAAPIHDALANFHTVIRKAFLGFDAFNQERIDRRLCEIDGTPDKSRLGGNTILAFSIAILKAAAASKKMPLWRLVEDISESKKSGGRPRLLVNVINGGLHAGNNLAFQEYLIIPKTNAYFEAAEISSKIYHSLRIVLAKEKGEGAVNLGDEGGFAPDFRDNLEPFEFIKKAAEEAGLLQKIDLGLDAAAGAGKLSAEEMKDIYPVREYSRPATYDARRGVSSSHTNRGSNIPREFSNGVYKKMISQYKLFYLEDPFSEDEPQNFAALLAECGDKTLIAGDDLTTTNPEQIKKAAEEKAINAVIIKPNQIGTVSQAIEAVRVARAHKILPVVSHRSGETNDDFIADFAHGVHAFGFKLGAPARGERLAKYNRLLAIESR